MQFDSLKKIIDSGKKRGYSDSKYMNGELFHFWYGLSYSGDTYFAYYSYIEDSKIAMPEEYEIDDSRYFNNFEDAINYLISKGADINLFSSYKGSKARF